VTDEKLLIDRARRGDMEAFHELVERSKIMTYRVAYDLTGNRQDAEDLSQEVYVRAYRALKNFRGDSKWSTWLYRIITNVSHDHWRKESTRRIDYMENLENHNSKIDEAKVQANPGPDRIAEGAIIQSNIDRALNALSPQERTVFVLRHYNHLQLNEIAATLKIAEGTVKSYLFRAVKTLQKELAFYRPELGLEKQS
jgi:RNA polymerase sigma-70 factor (ECF subfamily)